MKVIKGKIVRWPQDLIAEALSKPAVMYQGVRRIIQDMHWETAGLPEISYEDLGYTKAKERQLLRNYFDLVEFDRAKDILDKRKKKHGMTSVSISLRGAKKDSRSMGWCMLSMTVSRFRDYETVDIHYRSTELLFKFSADLVFLRTFLLPYFDLHPRVIRFHFVNAFISGGYLGTMFRFVDPIGLLEGIRTKDPDFFKKGTRVIMRMVSKEDQTWLYSPHKQQHKQLWKFFGDNPGRRELKIIKNYLKTNGIKAEVARDQQEEDEE